MPVRFAAFVIPSRRRDAPTIRPEQVTIHDDGTGTCLGTRWTARWVAYMEECGRLHLTAEAAARAEWIREWNRTHPAPSPEIPRWVEAPSKGDAYGTNPDGIAWT